MTTTFDEKVKGWTSFYTYQPDCMLSLDSNFYTFKNGNLYVHHSDNVNRNTFYGTFSQSKISTIFNDSPSEIKVIRAVGLEGNVAWDISMKAYVTGTTDYTSSTINDTEFVKKEGVWYAYARRDETAKQKYSKSMYGIGNITNITNNNVKVLAYNSSLTIGDTVIKSGNSAIIGTITAIVSMSETETVITLSSVAGLGTNDFIVGSKNERIEGGNLRGYSIRLDLTSDKTSEVELYAVNAEVNKSYR